MLDVVIALRCLAPVTHAVELVSSFSLSVVSNPLSNHGLDGISAKKKLYSVMFVFSKKFYCNFIFFSENHNKNSNVNTNVKSWDADAYKVKVAQ